ncbi:putative quinol monooxygenase [Pseudomonas sp. Gutcm_11s]|uniref:putative quinol monooxygenase n=1 Tax=Pseudomonas sp. Gutcm_11s TaxID=3026088 RepID=UPI0023617CF4|nr:antibiotic biosynthesis monooxygenase family protein [Pseudomonas sp. Gutcm_11s]MDD0844872.1 antibiotic biosynthesis monooxygenase [Pseudomonas sp. Gutcm_11s]
MIEVITQISCQPGQRQAVLEALLANQARVQGEVGCIAYRPLQDAAAGLPEQVMDADELLVHEQWQSLKHLQAHLASPHVQEFQRDTAQWVREVRLRVLQTP